MSQIPSPQPYLAGIRVWVLVAAGVALAVVTVVAVGWWEQRALDNACERLDRRVVTNQEEADDLFDDKAAAGCLNRD